MTLGEKIRQTRLQRGYSQENMAEMLGISTTAFGDIERNKTELSIVRAKEIAKHLSISFLELLGLEIQEEKELLQKLQTENASLKRKLEQLTSETL